MTPPRLLSRIPPVDGPPALGVATGGGLGSTGACTAADTGGPGATGVEGGVSVTPPVKFFRIDSADSPPAGGWVSIGGGATAGGDTLAVSAAGTGGGAAGPAAGERVVA